MNYDLSNLPDKVFGVRELHGIMGCSRQTVHIWQYRGLGGVKLDPPSHRAITVGGRGCLGWKASEVAQFFADAKSARHLDILFRHFGL